MQKSLKNAGLASDLAGLVAADRNISMDVENKDNLAVRTGVVLADLVLTVKTSTKESKLASLEKLKADSRLWALVTTFKQPSVI